MKPASSPTFDVAVIGGGAVGAATALGLSRIGLHVAIVAPEGPVGQPGDGGWDPRVYAISPASRGLLQRLRVWDALDAERVAPVYDMRVWADVRASAPELAFSAYEACIDALAWIVEGRNIAAALDRGLAFAGVERIDDRVGSVNMRDGEASVLGLASGRVVGARLVVGADGARSPVRTMLGIGAEERAYPQSAIVANFDTGLPHRDCAYQWFGAHGILALLPLPGQRCSMVWSAPAAALPELLALSEEAFSARVAELSGRLLGDLAMITPRETFPLRLTRVARFSAPRAVLVGDAAHAVHPLSGQGMNLGFGDVAALLEVLEGREAFRDLGDPLLLRRYERARREPVAMMQFTTDGLQRLFDPEAVHSLPGPLRPLVGLREFGWRFVGRSPWLKRRLITHAAS